LAGSLDRRPEIVRVDIGAFSLMPAAMNIAGASIDCRTEYNSYIIIK